MNSQKNLWVALIAVGIIAIAGLFTGGGRATIAGAVSGVTNFSKLGVTELKVGSGCGDGFTYSGCTGLVINATSGLVNSLVSSFTALVTLDAGVNHSYTNSTSTTATTLTATAAQITNYTSVLMTPNVATLTLTLPASSTLSAYIPVAGDWAQQCWYNATTTAGVNIVFAAGVGIDMEIASSTGTGSGTITPNLTIRPGNTGCFRFMRQPATATAFDITAQFTAFVDAD